MSDFNNIEEIESLKEQLSAIDEKAVAAIKPAENDVEETYTVVAINILKLETIDTFIKNNCSEETVFEAFGMYTQTAMDSIQLLMGTSEDEE